MKCPVCNSLISPSITDSQEDFYYDCETCYSSLFFQRGECQVLKTNSVYKESLEEFENQKKTSQEEQDSLEVPEITQAEEKYLEESFSQAYDKESLEESKESASVQEEAPFAASDQESFSQSFQEEADSLEEQVSSPVEEESDSKSKDPLKEEMTPEQEAFESSVHLESEASSEEESEDSFENAPPLEDGKENFSEVTEFGNFKNLGREGLFYYDLILSELNSEEVCQKVESFLEDPAFRWKQALEVRDGVLEIKKISPVKAHVIVKSLIGLPVKIFWKQHVVIESES